MMRRFLFTCALAASLAAGAVQARQAPAPSSASAAAAPAAAAAAQVSPPAPAPVPQAMTAGPAAGSLIQTIFALCLVLGLLAGLAWFMKRYGPKAQGGSAHVKLVGALSLGGRERIMVVEVGDQWIVVGASPGRVNALATMPRKESINPGIGADATLHPHQPSASSFAEWLKQTIDKRNAK
jgi:flagellar protein FliO/FliZ